MNANILDRQRYKCNSEMAADLLEESSVDSFIGNGFRTERPKRRPLREMMDDGNRTAIISPPHSKKRRTSLEKLKNSYDLKQCTSLPLWTSHRLLVFARYSLNPSETFLSGWRPPTKTLGEGQLPQVFALCSISLPPPHNSNAYK